MSYTGFDPDIPQATKYGDTPNLDACGRLRVSNPLVIFDSKQNRGFKESLVWAEELTSGGTSTLQADKSSTALTVTNSSDKVIRQSRARIIYQPGRSMLHYLTFVSPTEDAGVRWRVGFFDSDDGIFLEWDGTNYNVVVRSSTSGSPSDANKQVRSSWYDPLDGTGPSGVTKNFNGQNMLMWLDLQWLALGRVRVGLEINGSILPMAVFDATETNTGAYMKNPNLVHRYEIEAIGVPGAARTLESICSAAFSEGGHNPLGISSTASNGRTGVSVTDVYQELLAIRVKAANVTNETFIIDAISMICSTSGNIHFVVLLNPANTTGGSWTSSGAATGVEYATGRTFTTPWAPGNEEHILYEGYFSADSDTISLHLDNRVVPGASVANVPDEISIVAANASAAGAETVFCSVELHELH